MEPKEIKNILIVDLAGIGDLVLSVPAVRAVRLAYKEAHISLLVIKRSASLLSGWHLVDHIFALDMDSTSLRQFFSGRVFPRAFRLLGELRHSKFDLVVNLENIGSWKGAFKMAALFTMIGPRISAGRDTDGRGFFYRIKVKERSRDHEHSAVTMARVAGAVGAEVSDMSLELPVSPEADDHVRTFLSQNGIRGDERFIVLNPGAFHAHKRWPQENWIELAGLLMDAYEVAVIFTFYSGEAESVSRTVQKFWKKRIVTFVNRDLPELTALMRKCCLCVTNDSGPMHIAAAVGTPVVALFGPSDVHKFGPYGLGKAGVIVRKEINCSRPCFRRDCPSSRCMQAISISDVMEAAGKVVRHG